MEAIDKAEFPLSTTPRRCNDLVPCQKGVVRMQTYLRESGADMDLDAPLPYYVMLDAIGLFMTAYCCPAEPQHDRHWRRFAVWCARQVQHLMSSPECIAALDVAERFCTGDATESELAAASASAWMTAQDVDEAPGWLAIRRANEAAAHASDCRTLRVLKALPCSTPVLGTAIAAVEAFGLHKSLEGASAVSPSIREATALKKYNERAMLDRQKAAFRLLVTKGYLP